MLKESTTEEAAVRNGIMNIMTRKTLYEDSTSEKEKVKEALSLYHQKLESTIDGTAETWGDNRDTLLY